MEELSTLLDVKTFRLLLNGIKMKLFPMTDEVITISDLQAVVRKSFPDLDEESISNEINLFESVSSKCYTDRCILTSVRMIGRL